jgi:DNA-binding transcriptional ArsR family regulator
MKHRSGRTPYCWEFNDMERSSMTISTQSAHLLTVLKDPLRLRILLALEENPRSAAQLARDLDLPYFQVNWAMKSLAFGGLAELTRTEPGPSGQTIQKVYAARHSGWRRLLPVLDAIAATEDGARA